MRKLLIIGAGIAGFIVLAINQIGTCPMHHREGWYQKEMKHREKMGSREYEFLKFLKQAKIEVTNIENGATIKITADNPDTVKKIQEFAQKSSEAWKAGKCCCSIYEKIEEQLSIRSVREDEIGKEAICPVTKKKFQVRPKTPAVDYKGETYYFCCPKDGHKFIENPDKYVEAKE